MNIANSITRLFRLPRVSALGLAVLAILPPAAHAAFLWTNPVSGNWSSAANWANDTGAMGAPMTAGRSSYVLNFFKAGAYTSTHDLDAGFLLNQLNFDGAAVTLAGNGLAFTNDGAALPHINQNSSVAVTVSNNVVLGANLIFGGTGGGQVDLASLVSGTGSLTKNGAGTLKIWGLKANTYSGGTIINSGKLHWGTMTHGISPQCNTALGTGPVTLNAGATLELDNVGNAVNPLIFNGGTVISGNGWGATWNGPVTVNSDTTMNTPYGMSVGGDIRGVGGFVKTGNGLLRLSGSNSFSGALIVKAGTISVASLNRVSGGTAKSNLGAPPNVANGRISLGSSTIAGALTYTGSGETTDRNIEMAGTTGGVTITQSGPPHGFDTMRGQSGLLKFTGNIVCPGTPGADNRKTLTLRQAASTSTGSTPGAGEISGSIGDSALGNSGQLATSVTKDGPGTWTLSGTNTYTGTTRVLGGRLICTRADALGTGPLEIANDTAKLKLDFVGLRRIASLTLDGVTQPDGTYGSFRSIATIRDDQHFAGPGVVAVGSITSPSSNSLALTRGANPSSGGSPLTFTATVTGGNSPAGSVVFYDGVTPLSTKALSGSGLARFSTSILADGVHWITALYLGNPKNPPCFSASLAQTVVESRPATMVALARTGGINPSRFGAGVTFTATVAGARPRGTVVFYEGTTAIGSADLNSWAQASFTTRALASGWRGMVARYLGDANNAPSLSVSPLWQTVTPPAGNGKLKVFILAGQSNMQGKGSVEAGRDPNNYHKTIPGGLGSLRHMLNVDSNKLGYLVDANRLSNTTVPGWRTMTNVWVSYFTSTTWPCAMTEARKGYLDADFGDLSSQGRIGPEYGFGLVVGSQLGDPLLIIKTAWGGTSLAREWHPPSSGGTVGPCYTSMVAIVHGTLARLSTELTNFNYNGGGYEIAGFGWHQGWNDRISRDFVAQYETNFINLIKDVRAEFRVPKLPFVIATTAMANADLDPTARALLAAQAAVANPVRHPELAGTVFTVDARPFDYGETLGVNDQGFHWNFTGESLFNIGQNMGLGMMSLLSSKPAGFPATQPQSK